MSALQLKRFKIVFSWKLFLNQTYNIVIYWENENTRASPSMNICFFLGRHALQFYFGYCRHFRHLGALKVKNPWTTDRTVFNCPAHVNQACQTRRRLTRPVAFVNWHPKLSRQPINYIDGVMHIILFSLWIGRSETPKRTRHGCRRRRRMFHNT